MSIDERQEKIIGEFENLGDSMEKYLYLIELGRSAPALDDAYKTGKNLINGCQAEVWLRGYEAAGRIHFEVDSPSLIVKGIAVLLVRVLSGESPAAILDAELYFIERIGLKQQLSPTRSNGLFSMVKRMRSIAQACTDEDASIPAAGTKKETSR
ncbi:MAG: Fe-S metabolism protein SufE [Chromatiales bacterium 21-64-14]|nr:MAG: Fe-S metabolism protein SufE [Chromatiales bacterium 21-64-14]